MLSDLRFSLRALLKSPGFLAVAVLTMALGVGANTAIFSVVNAVLLKPFPYVDGERILFIGSTQGGPENMMPVTYADFRDWEQRSRKFRGLAWASNRAFVLTGQSDPAAVDGAIVSASVWPLLGLSPALGRTFAAEEDRPGAAATCVISHGFWQGRLAGDPGVLGRSLILDGRPVTVIGVMPPRFKFWGADIWQPAGLEADTEMMRSRVIRMNSWVVGTPLPGVTLEEATAELNLIAGQLGQEYPESNRNTGAIARLLSDSVTGPFRQPLMILLGAVACVLLIACANVANLILARTASRQREYAIRIALGASRGQLIRRMLVETSLLTLAGGLAGLIAGAWGLHALIGILPDEVIPAEASIVVNGRVIAASLGVLALTMFGFGLYPALEGSRPSGQEALQEGSRGTAGTRTARVRSALIVAEVALSLTLLIGAGLFLRSFANQRTVDPGFNARNLLIATTQLPDTRYPTTQAATTYFTELVERLRTAPGVKAVAATTNAPFVNGSGLPFLVDGRTYADLNELDGGQFSLVTGDYFAAQGLALVRGRTFTEADRAGSEPVIILNEEAVKEFLPEGDPLGRRIGLGLPENLNRPGLLPPELSHAKWATVVGVVRSVRQFGIRGDPPPGAYLPVHQGWDFLPLRSAMTILVRTEGDPLNVVPTLRQVLRQQDPEQPFGQIATMEAVLADSLQQSRFNTILLGLFAAVALALALIGIYGIVAWNVAQRTREIGIRQALGAGRDDVLRLIVGQAMRIVLLGIVIGLGLAFAATHAVESMVFGLSALDPWTFALVVALVVVVSLLACLLPALRATRIEPITALRSE